MNRLVLRMGVVALSAVLALPVGVASAHDGDEHVHPAPASPKQVGFELLGTANPGTGSTGDVYAFDGFAYLGSWIGQGCLSKGIRVYDLSDPRHPTQVSTFADAASNPALAGTWTEKVIVQRVHTRSFRGVLAAVSFQSCSSTDQQAFRGFGVYDVTDPRHPRELSRYSAPGTRGSHEIWLGAHGGRAFVYTAIIRSELTTSPTFDPVTRDATVPGRADFRIVDVTDPRRPRDTGEWGAWRELGIKPNADGRANFVHSVRVDDNLRRAYLSYWDLGTVLLDISDPARPRFLGRTTPTQGATHSSFVTRGGTLLVETHETEAGLPVYYDISRPSQPRQLSTFSVEGFGNDTVHDPKVRGATTFFSWYSLGVVAARSAVPTRPTLLAQFVPDTDYINPDFFCEEPCAQVWGVALEGGLVLASDMNSGLYVLRLR
ncbi:MAG TPA: hypothetical protein VGX25_10080 [Actinophytocola sp.]|uniref:LVIVD repeat-containing protein n=1 Tax=Actinophytocola sp. TaxID=1872138 RepID=UPI002DDD5F8C|nr:hypothetical protein [Actinophytocola sp.]HEV2779736.1 hypothetical protein [Actinophytocola sp.]